MLGEWKPEEEGFRNSGVLQGGRKQGRQKNRWEENIREWTGLEFAKCRRAVENRENGREVVVKSSAVTQQPPPLPG